MGRFRCRVHYRIGLAVLSGGAKHWLEVGTGSLAISLRKTSDAKWLIYRGAEVTSYLTNYILNAYKRDPSIFASH